MRPEVPFWMRKIGQLWRLVRESHERPLAGAQSKPPEVGADETAITFIGHSSFLIQTAGHALLVDPVFATRLIVLRRQRRAGLRIQDLPAIDAVLLTHAHMDHLNRPSLRAVTREMRRRGLAAPAAIVPNGVEDLVRDLGFGRVESLEWWQSTELAQLDRRWGGEQAVPIRRSAGQVEKPSPETIRITATPARHWGARMFRDTHRGFGGYVIESASGPTIYHSGDSAYFGGFAGIGRRLHPDIALLPIGAYFPDSYRAVHTSPEEALQAFVDLKADVLIPMHYGTFRLGREPMDEPLPRLMRAAERARVADRVSALSEGESWTSSNAAQHAQHGSVASDSLSGAKALSQTAFSGA
jgi:L-ascorbate metabolism protein UlaG (beta-lactamase superfamily)